MGFNSGFKGLIESVATCFDYLQPSSGSTCTQCCLLKTAINNNRNVQRTSAINWPSHIDCMEGVQQMAVTSSSV